MNDGIDRTLACYDAGKRMSEVARNVIDASDTISGGTDTSPTKWHELSVALGDLQLSLGESKMCDPEVSENYDEASQLITYAMNNHIKDKDRYDLPRMINELLRTIYDV